MRNVLSLKTANFWRAFFKSTANFWRAFFKSAANFWRAFFKSALLKGHENCSNSIRAAPRLYDRL